jgi:hypothetical protein
VTSLLDGAVIDLDRVQVALDGSRWLWTCEHTESGDPLMHRLDAPADVVPLDYVVRWHGAISPDPQPVTAAMCRQVLLQGVA